MNKTSHYCGIIHNETSKKICKPKKTLNITNRNWGGLVHNSLNLAKIHVHTISINNVIKEFHFNLMKFTFIQFGIKFNFLELVQNKSNTLFMLFKVLGANEDVINVTNHEII
jgi:hypothetical protein